MDRLYDPHAASPPRGAGTETIHVAMQLPFDGHSFLFQYSCIYLLRIRYLSLCQDSEIVFLNNLKCRTMRLRNLRTTLVLTFLPNGIMKNFIFRFRRAVGWFVIAAFECNLTDWGCCVEGYCQRYRFTTKCRRIQKNANEICGESRETYIRWKIHLFLPSATTARNKEIVLHISTKRELSKTKVSNSET